MFILLPLRVEDAAVDRLPWVSISIAGLCAALFLVTYVAPRDPDGMPDQVMVEIVRHWDKHRHLALPERFLGLLQDRYRAEYEEEHAQAVKSPPEDHDLEAEQRELDEKVAQFFRRADRSPLRRLALVPDRGWAQIGLVSHMFLHLGWMHLLGNMLFFYITGLLLEDRWGRPLFAGFYLLGGVVAGTAHYLLEPRSPVLMVGASGAVAACMGAFAVRFATERIRMAYLFWAIRLFRGTFLIPAWLWGLFWFGSEVLTFAVAGGAAGGVAVMAHIGGFAFGSAAAMGLKLSGVERRYIQPMVEKRTLAFARPPGLDLAEAALARGDEKAARQALQEALREHPDLPEAELLMIKLERTSSPAAATARTERLLTQLAAKGGEALWPMVEEMGDLLQPSALRPQVAFRVGTALESAPEGLLPIAEQCFVASAERGGPLAPKAWLRAAQLRLDSHGPAQGALDSLERLRRLPGLTQEIQSRADELERRAREVLAREQGHPSYAGRAAIELDEEPAAVPAAAPSEFPELPPVPSAVAPEAGSAEVRIVDCQLTQLTREGVSLQLQDGSRTQVPFAKLLAVAAAVAPLPAPGGGEARNVLFTDLVISWGGRGTPAVVLRLPSWALGLQNLYPATPPQEAYGLLLAQLLDRSGATALPDHNALRRGEYPRYGDVAALNEAFYGAK